MNNKINPMLDNEINGNINSLNINTDVDQISIGISNTSSLNKNSNVTFENVNAFYFIDEESNLSDTLTKSSALNLISYHQDGFGEFTSVTFSSQDEVMVSIPNFAVMMNDSSLYIDADLININGKSFRVKF